MKAISQEDGPAIGKAARAMRHNTKGRLAHQHKQDERAFVDDKRRRENYLSDAGSRRAWLRDKQDVFEGAVL
jgi:hypothetical protein